MTRHLFTSMACTLLVLPWLMLLIHLLWSH